ncbi:hypothetical protein HZB03_02665 [Candidatus Woesearchaeota archaeon]|nr:hypothetical protein [Candidatus Woesearchaeota archaeon]
MIGDLDRRMRRAGVAMAAGLGLIISSFALTIIAASGVASNSISPQALLWTRELYPLGIGLILLGIGMKLHCIVSAVNK